MFKSIVNNSIGILLIPALIGVARAFYQTISAMDTLLDSTLILERGILVYLLFHVFVIRPVYLYVLGHESVHVLATWLCGGRVQSFNVTPAGGSVATSKTNVFIELSPYFVPIYTLLLGPVFMLVKILGWNVSDVNSVFLFLVGVTLAFHFVMTSEVLKLQQPDIAKSGLILSAVIIVGCNLIITMGVFCLFFSDLSFIEFIKEVSSYTGEAYTTAYEKITTIVGTIVA